ncbi:MAG: fatty acid CoA ligase family protein [Thermoguttaceae bacterium]
MTTHDFSSQNRYCNIADRLTHIASVIPDKLAIAEPVQKTKFAHYRTITFAELDADSSRIAENLLQNGVRPGMKLALFVKYGIDFISLVFALCKARVTLVLIDPGMGIRRMLDCLAEIDPDGFIAIPPVHFVRILMRRSFPNAKFNVTVGRRFFWGGLSLDDLRSVTQNGVELNAASNEISSSNLCDKNVEGALAAIIFTSGSTGPPKGVAFTHKMFDTQVEEISTRLGIVPGDVDLACFPFFGLFDAAMGVTAILPDMDTTRPATVDPSKIVDAIRFWKITQAFASPALWHRVANYCDKKNEKLETLRRAVSAGAPISASLLAKLKPFIHPDGDIFTPYGATEALPTALISATEVLNETRFHTQRGGGVCVGKRFSQITWKVIAISDEPIARLEDAIELPYNQIGELIVTGPQVTTMYVNRPGANASAKICDEKGTIWHRMGDVGYIDEHDRFWFCGRKAHRVETPEKTYYSIPCEAIFNQHSKIYRSALVASKKGGTPRVYVEPFPEYFPKSKKECETMLTELHCLGIENELTKEICDIRVVRAFPVDVRHNAKINRELMATWK